MSLILNWIHFRRLLSVIFFLVCPIAVAETSKELQLGEPVPLIGITGVDDVMSPIEEPNAIEGGAMGMQRFFTTKIVAALNNCVSQTRRVFVSWHTEHELLPASEKVETYSMVMRLWDKKKEGLFEAGYKLNQDKKFIRVSLDYFRLNGDKVSPASIESLISDYKLNNLWGKLSEAMECN